MSAEVKLAEVTATKAMPVREMLPTVMPDSVIPWEQGKMYLGSSNSTHLGRREVQDKQHNNKMLVWIRKDTMMVIRLWSTTDTPDRITT